MDYETIKRFTNHVPTNETLEKMRLIRTKVRELSYLIQQSCPNTREKATALTQLSFVMMSANSAIVQQDPINIKDLTKEETEFVTEGDK